ncbi:MAG TPA: signal peptidase I [Dongiaceae bacterium]|nr:signal peptidase I [Dongiaceae bacterium]
MPMEAVADRKLGKARLALRRLLAFLLSLACPGLGQYYAGRPVRACASLAAFWLLFVPLAVELPVFVAWGPWTILASMGVAVALQFIVPVDAAFCVQAGSVGGARNVKRWLGGIAFALAGLAALLFMPEWLKTHVPRRLSQVPSSGMRPALQEGDSVIFERDRPDSSPPLPGEIVALASPGNPQEEFIKRVVGLPGNTVEVREGRLILDGTERTALSWDGGPGSNGTERLGGKSYPIRAKGMGEMSCLDWGPARVPDGAYFVLGDDRCRSVDSREWGAVPADHFRGRVLRIQWSADPATGKVRWSRLGIDLTAR